MGFDLNYAFPGPESDEPGPLTIRRVLRAGGVEQIAYVPDAGYDELINLMLADDQVRSIVLTTEEEGIAIASAAITADLRFWDDVTGFKHQLMQIEFGPRQATVHIVPDSPRRRLPPCDGAYLKNRFGRQLALPPT